MEKSPVRSDAYFPEWKPAFSSCISARLLISKVLEKKTPIDPDKISEICLEF